MLDKSSVSIIVDPSRLTPIKYFGKSTINEYHTKFSQGVEWMTRLGVKGTIYRVSNMWFDVIPNMNTPIKYLEIGTFYGANAISVNYSYAQNPESEIHCIDPWEDYSDYPEYKNEQNKIYNDFMSNINSCEFKDKFKIHRGYSNVKLLEFKDDYFDIIYIDGNHEPEYIIEDAVLSFRKLKPGGFMIFDDYEWGDSSIGIDSFCKCYKKKIKILSQDNYQLYLEKLSDIPIVREKLPNFQLVRK